MKTGGSALFRKGVDAGDVCLNQMQQAGNKAASRCDRSRVGRVKKQDDGGELECDLQ